MASFVKYSILFAVLASVYAAPKPQFPVYPPPPPPFGPPRFLPGPPHPVPVPVPVPHPVPHPVPVPRAYPVPAPRAEASIPIVSQSFDLSPDGAYQFSYEGGDGSSRQESGVPKAAPGGPPGAENLGGIGVQGRFSYPSEQGQVTVEYIADENGYQPSGPSIHPAIQQAVAAQVAQARAEGPTPPQPTAYSQPASYPRPVPVPAPFPHSHPVPVPVPHPVPVPVPAPPFPGPYPGQYPFKA